LISILLGPGLFRGLFIFKNWYNSEEKSAILFCKFKTNPYFCIPLKNGLLTMSQRIRIKLQSYDHNLVDKSAEKIVKTVRSTGAVITGPIPLPTKKMIFTVLKSPHVNKKAREQFQLCTHKRLLDIYTSSSRTVDALSKLDLPSGVDVEIKA
jgi:small subunit ribosomal protein S10